MIITPARFLCGLLAGLLLPGFLWAMDPRFELDLRTLGSPAPRNAAGTSNAPETRMAAKSVKTRKTGRRATAAKRTKSIPFRKTGRSAAAEPSYGLQLMGAAVRNNESEGLDMLERIWDELLPTENTRHEVDVETGQFVLSLDPEKYPLMPAADGGKILIDKYRSMPPLVKSLLTQNEPDIRIVNESPARGPGFIRAVLNAAGFYSLEQDMDIGFGSDPKLVVHADYKIERDAESLLRHDVILLNVGKYQSAMPQPLVDFMKNEGFRVVEPTLPKNGIRIAGMGEIHQILAQEPEKIADSLMDALAISFERDRNLEMAGFSDHGITLKIRADRYFATKGKNFVVSFFNGDPVSYTLVRLMETSGYRVIILDQRDDLKSISEKFSSRLQLGGQYGVHKLWDSREMPYNLEMSGMMMHDVNSQKRIVVTNRIMEPLTRELAELNGYTLLRY